MYGLIDGDIVAFRCSVTVPEEDLSWLAVYRTAEMLDNIIRETEVDGFKIFISGTNNFRYQLYPKYKGDRPPKPIHYEACINSLCESYNVEITDGYEADDGLGIAQTEDTIICSNDKDMLMIPGNHYNFVKKEFYKISITEGYRNFYKQMLIGDRVDNIIGVKNIGVKRAGYFLDPVSNVEDMFDIVRDLYNDDARMLLNGKLLWILQKEGEIYWHSKLPESLLIGQNLSEQQQEVKSNFSMPTEDQANQSLEPTEKDLIGIPVHGH